MESKVIEYADCVFHDGVVVEPRVVLETCPGVAPRLNVLLPHYSASMAYGGVVSALELARAASAGFERVRFVSERPWAMTADPVDLRAFVSRPDHTTIETAELSASGAGLVCHQRDIFFCTFWTTVLAWEAYAAALVAAGLEPNPFYYFIQDFEPGFYPQNYKHCRALHTYTHAQKTYAIFNARELAAYFRGQGHAFQREAVLAPSLHQELHAHLAAMRFKLPPKPTDRIVILMYGRPDHPRNCFSAILEGLHAFFEPMTPVERQRFMVLSAGAPAPHPDIRLFPEASIKSVGKLSIEKYIAYLGFSHLGVSLMASPHPSYPPLEMAAFGLYVVTNRFAHKDLSRAHPNIRSIDQPWPANLAAALRDGVVWLGRAGKPAARRAVLPANMSPLPWRENVAALQLESLAPANA